VCVLKKIKNGCVCDCLSITCLCTYICGVCVCAATNTHIYLCIYVYYLQHRSVIDDGFAAAGGGGDGDVLSLEGGVDGGGLVCEEAGHTCVCVCVCVSVVYILFL
jgi:hypothetical protein